MQPCNDRGAFQLLAGRLATWSERYRVDKSPKARASPQIASELAGVMAPLGMPADDLVAASSGLLGFALANVELSLSGQLDAETAWRVTCDYATSGLAEN